MELRGYALGSSPVIVVTLPTEHEWHPLPSDLVVTGTADALLGLHAMMIL